MTDLFLSYAWGEKSGKTYRTQTKVNTLKGFFENNYHWKCWMDIDQVAAGNQLLEKIEEGIRSCTVFVAMLTQDYARSKTCKKEMAAADALGKPIIALLLDKESQQFFPPKGLTMYLAGALYVPFNDKIELDKRPFWSKSNMEKVTSQIKEHITEARQTNTEIAVDEDAGLKRITTRAWEYIGEMKGNTPDGYGIKTWKNFTTYEGQWKDGAENGHGRLVVPNEYVYEGRFQDSLFNGRGTLTTHSALFTGYFKDGSAREGMCHYVNGMLRVPNQGTAHDPGKIARMERDIEEGATTDGDLNEVALPFAAVINDWGRAYIKKQVARAGVTAYPQKAGMWYTGDIYRGTFEGFGLEWMQHGEGVFNYANGDMYDGQWKNGKPHGSGVYYYNSGPLRGEYYSGEWVNGVKEGEGLYGYANPEKTAFTGTWVKGYLKQKHNKITKASDLAGPRPSLANKSNVKVPLALTQPHAPSPPKAPLPPPPPKPLDSSGVAYKKQIKSADNANFNDVLAEIRSKTQKLDMDDDEENINRSTTKVPRSRTLKLRRAPSTVQQKQNYLVEVKQSDQSSVPTKKSYQSQTPYKAKIPQKHDSPQAAPEIEVDDTGRGERAEVSVRTARYTGTNSGKVSKMTSLAERDGTSQKQKLEPVSTLYTISDDKLKQHRRQNSNACVLQ